MSRGNGSQKPKQSCDVQSDCDRFHNGVTLTFDLCTFGSMHAEPLP